MRSIRELLVLKVLFCNIYMPVNLLSHGQTFRSCRVTDV